MGLASAAAMVLASVGVTQAMAKGVAPGSFNYKLHGTVPLLVQPGPFPELQRAADAQMLYETPSVVQAGAHADASVMWILTVPGGVAAVIRETEVPSSILVDAPPGVFTNLNAVPACSHEAFKKTVAEDPDGGCEVASQVGVVSFLYGGFALPRAYPLYKLTPAAGDIATFGYPYELITRVGAVVHAKLRAEEDYGITLAQREGNIRTFAPSSFMTFWGVPASSTHDAERWNPETLNWGASVAGPPVALMTNASDCGEKSLESRIRISYRFEEANFLPSDPDDHAYRFSSPAPRGCENLTLDPRFQVSATASSSDSPSGLDVELDLPRNPDPNGLETPPLEGGEIKLPTGMSINPGAAVGLEACSPEQIGLLGSRFPPPNPVRFSVLAAQCPEGSKIGITELHTPLVEEPIQGSIYLAEPYQNPFESPLALYLVYDGPSVPGADPHFTVKLAAQVDVDPVTGRTSVRADSLPQLPIDSVAFHLFGGPKAPLATPPFCGGGGAEARLTPWSAPSPGSPAISRDGIELGSAPGGGRCPGRLADRPFSPTFAVAAEHEIAAVSSPLLLFFTRRDGDQELKALSVTLPRGLAASLRSFAHCGGDGIKRAESRSHPGGGLLERRDPSCPMDSRVGSLVTEVGPGPQPLTAEGNVYLAGPYGGAPLSLVAIVPALAGSSAADPLFDLGTVVYRAGVTAEPQSGKLTLHADRIPQSVGGIPLRIEALGILFDAADFIHTPSGCGEKRATAEVEGADGGRSVLAHRFQVGECKRLPFRPSLRLGLTKGRRLGMHPKLRALLMLGKGDAAVARARITLPRAQLLNRSALTNACTETSFTERSCPRRSLIGRATVRSPFFGEALRGLLYLRSSGEEMPDLVLDLAGPVPIEVVGELALTPDRRIQITFTNLPDLPLERLAVSMRGGGTGFLTNGEDLCGRTVRLGVRLTAHNGRVESRRLSAVRRCVALAGGRCCGK